MNNNNHDNNINADGSERRKETTNDNLSSPPTTAAQHDKLTYSQYPLSSSLNNEFVTRKPTHYIFRDPVMIPPDSVPSAADNVMMSDDMTDEEYEFYLYSPDFFSKFLMIVMFNLALTLHLHAQSLLVHNNTATKEVRKLFVRSRKLYELAFEMHLDETCDVELLFTLALINNLGLVYHTLNETARSQKCFKNMFSTMMYLMDINESQSIKEWDGLLSNVMDLLLKHSYEVTAPAA